MSELKYKTGDIVVVSKFLHPQTILQVDQDDSIRPYRVGGESISYWIGDKDITGSLPPVKEKQRASLTNWRIDKRERTWCLVGDIKDHEMHTEGTHVVTTALIWINFKTGEAETKNTIYKLL